VIKELVYTVKYILGKDLAGRNLTVFPDDTFVVSYPRSGNTWARFLIANLLHPEKPVTFANIERLIPDLYAHPRRFLNSIPRPRIIKSHEYFDARYPRTVYIVRDPRDVVISSYHFYRKQRNIPEGYSLERYASDFVSGAVFQNYASWGENVASWVASWQHRSRMVGRSADAGSPFGSWAENVGSWVVKCHGRKTFLLLRYEDMVEQPERELAKVAAFLGIETTSESLAAAVERSSFNRMRQMEKEQSKLWFLTKNTRQDIPFVRSSSSGQWKSGLAEGCVAAIESTWGPLITALGYELTTLTTSSLTSASASGSVLQALVKRNENDE
jgi:hypothetical protein